MVQRQQGGAGQRRLLRSGAQGRTSTSGSGRSASSAGRRVRRSSKGNCDWTLQGSSAWTETVAAMCSLAGRRNCRRQVSWIGAGDQLADPVGFSCGI